jgi:hypothetical protein
LDEVIEEIMELMIRSVDTISKDRLNRKREAEAAAAVQKQQQQQENGVDGELRIFVWDLGGFPTAERGSS